MIDKPLHILFLDLLSAGAAVSGIFLALKIFHIPNCTSLEKHAVFVFAPGLSWALAAAAVVELVIGVREASQLSKSIAALSLIAAIFLGIIYRWKVNTILTLAC